MGKLRYLLDTRIAVVTAYIIIIAGNFIVAPINSSMKLFAKRLRYLLS
jgi:hypothetical protein